MDAIYALKKELETLYNKASATLKINGELIDPFLLESSSRQGCLVRPLLFAIFIELQAQWIEKNNMKEGISMAVGEQKLAIFPDDLLVHLSSPADSHHELILDE